MLFWPLCPKSISSALGGDPARVSGSDTFAAYGISAFAGDPREKGIDSRLGAQTGAGGQELLPGSSPLCLGQKKAEVLKLASPFHNRPHGTQFRLPPVQPDLIRRE